MDDPLHPLAAERPPSAPVAVLQRTAGVSPWIYVLVPAALALMMSDFDGWRRPIELLRIYAICFAITLCMGQAISVLCRWVPCRLGAQAWPRPARVGVYAVLVLAGVAVGGEAAVRIVGWLRLTDDTAAMRPKVFRIGLVVSTTVMIASLAYNRMRAHARAVERLEESARRAALRAQLAALQARTDPHFLYNSLNTVAGLIEEDPRRAEAVLHKLSALFRYALEGSRQHEVPLGNELRAVSDYLEVEQLRLDDRLRTRIELDPTLAAVLVPPLLLQPVVENAIVHGVSRRREGGQVAVRARREGARLLLEVEDDGAGDAAPAGTGTGTALSDLRQRLLLLYGTSASVRTTRGEGGGWLVQLSLPLPDPPAPGGTA